MESVRLEAKAIGEAAGKKNRYGKSRGLERRRVEDISGKAFRSGGGRTERMPVMGRQYFCVPSCRRDREYVRVTGSTA